MYHYFMSSMKLNYFPHLKEIIFSSTREEKKKILNTLNIHAEDNKKIERVIFEKSFDDMENILIKLNPEITKIDILHEDTQIKFLNIVYQEMQPELTITNFGKIKYLIMTNIHFLTLERQGHGGGVYFVFDKLPYADFIKLPPNDKVLFKPWGSCIPYEKNETEIIFKNLFLPLDENFLNVLNKRKYSTVTFLNCVVIESKIIFPNVTNVNFISSIIEKNMSDNLNKYDLIPVKVDNPENKKSIRDLFPDLI